MIPKPPRASVESLVHATGAQVRALTRSGAWTRPTAGLARGYVQANLVILPAAWAEEFADFCRLNDRPCPLLEQTPPGDPQPRAFAPLADLRSDVPRYRVFRHGRAEAIQPTDVRHLWRDDLVGFLLGCSFTFESALVAAGLGLRHLQEGRNVPMYRTSRACTPAGRFSGNLVVSMRPFLPELIEQAVAITGHYPTMHGAPIHVGDPEALGIRDLACPDFGQSVTVRSGEVPVFWACGVTPQLAICASGSPLAITHSPGCMLVTDRRDQEFRV